VFQVVGPELKLRSYSERVILDFEVQKLFFAGKTVIENLADITTQK